MAWDKCRYFTLFTRVRKKTGIFNQANNSIYQDIRFFREDKDGNLWIGSNEGGSNYVQHENLQV